jgi:hypothetical protein
VLFTQSHHLGKNSRLDDGNKLTLTTDEVFEQAVTASESPSQLKLNLFVSNPPAGPADDDSPQRNLSGAF